MNMPSLAEMQPSIVPGPVRAVSHPSTDDRWDTWRAKGRADDLQFRHRLRMVVVDVAAMASLGGAVWLAL